MSYANGPPAGLPPGNVIVATRLDGLVAGAAAAVVALAVLGGLLGGSGAGFAGGSAAGATLEQAYAGIAIAVASNRTVARRVTRMVVPHFQNRSVQTPFPLSPSMPCVWRENAPSNPHNSQSNSQRFGRYRDTCWIDHCRVSAKYGKKAPLRRQFQDGEKKCR